MPLNDAPSLYIKATADGPFYYANFSRHRAQMPPMYALHVRLCAIGALRWNCCMEVTMTVSSAIAWHG
jgi:hypothetical protein